VTDLDDPEHTVSPRRRGGWKRFLQRALLSLGILGILAFVARWQVSRVGQQHLDEMTTELNATDPGWRLDEIEATRRKAAPPPEKNTANEVLRLLENFPPEWQEYRGFREWEWGPTTNYQPSFMELAWLFGGHQFTEEVRASMRSHLLKPESLACSAGHYSVIQNDNPIMTLLPHLQKARSVLDLLDYDARLSVMEGKAHRGIGSARAGLVVARSIGDEPYLISQLVRIASSRVAVHTAIQVLAWSEPKEGLVELQKELRAEADVPWLQYGLRGERGGIYKFFEGLKTGKIDYKDIGVLGVESQGTAHQVGFRVYKALLPGDQAKSLEILTQYLEASKLPPHEQKAALALVQRPPRPPEDFRYIGTNLIIPACEKVAEAGLRCRADLLTGSVAIACERFRQVKGHWPESLNDILKDILPEIPLDPFNGKPIQYKKFEDGSGVAIFTIGNDQDAKLKFGSTTDALDPLVGLGRGWKLWNKELRRQPHPLPEPDGNVLPMPPFVNP